MTAHQLAGIHKMLCFRPPRPRIAEGPYGVGTVATQPGTAR